MLKKKRTGNLFCLAAATVLAIAPAAAQDPAIQVVSNGDVGIGTATPETDLHVFGEPTEDVFGGFGKVVAYPGDCGFNFGYGGATFGPGVGFMNVRECAQDPDNVRLQFNVKGAERFRVTTAGAQVTGDLTITGDCVEADGACAPDYVFESSYRLESIADHAQYMWSNRHLPAVGAGTEDGSVNLKETTWGMLEELEKAHIYIERLNQTAEEKAAEIAELKRDNEELTARLDRIEAVLKASR